MNGNYIPRLSLDGVHRPIQADFTGHVQKMRVEPSEAQGSGFQHALSNVVNNVNQTLSAPDTLMRDAMTTGSVDVHDVMIANAKAELTVNMTAQVATKVIQAYDRILQIQI